jgi:MoaA/NifB/PqqE/SkfB family radical SAM enzyme
MRTERVFTNYRCNQNCTYCNSRRAQDELAEIQFPRVCGRLDAALAAGATELILTGGEPTLRSDLPALIGHARRAAGKSLRIVVETNATLVDEASACALRQAGLNHALVNLVGSSAAVDAVTHDPGGFEATLRGVRLLLLAGVSIEIQAALVRSTRELLRELPSRVASLMSEESLESSREGLRGIVLVVPTESPQPLELLAWHESSAAILELEASARSLGVSLRLGADCAPPPCAFPPGARVWHLYSSFGQGGGDRPSHRHLEACEGCLVREACPGVAEPYLARHPVPPMHPIAEERTRRRLTIVSSVKDQMRREFVTPSRYVSSTHGVVDEEVIRINFHCNQSCTFCFVSTHLPPMGDDAIRLAIVDAGRRGVRITLSGGEPTLNPRLVEYVALAKEHSRLPVQLQTNAVRLDDGALVAALATAQLDEAFVSLHGSTAEISDRVTEAPGTFARTVVGIDHLARTSIKTILNFVLCQANYADVGAFVELVSFRWPLALVNFSFVAPSSDVVPRERSLIPRYADVVPHVNRAVLAAHRSGIAICGFESMCGLPLCLVPEPIERLALSEIAPGYDHGEFLKTSECEKCTLKTRCYGLRRGYAAMYGTDELRAVTA